MTRSTPCRPTTTGAARLYNSNSTERSRANRVSFDRPAALSGKFLYDDFTYTHEYRLLRFLEREGYDVTYATDVDVHRDPSLLLDHKMAMTAGHGEYWTREMRDGFEAAREAGVHLAFMGSNTSYWQVRYEDDERTMVGYKKANTDPHPDPELRTVRFRDLRLRDRNASCSESSTRTACTTAARIRPATTPSSPARSTTRCWRAPASPPTPSCRIWWATNGTRSSRAARYPG